MEVVLHGVAGDLPPHVRAHRGRETVVDAGPDAGVRGLLDIVLQARPAMRDAGRGRRRQRELRDRQPRARHGACRVARL